MLLPGSEAGERLCAYAEQLLTDVSAAFHHSFSLMREKIGEKSTQEYHEALTEETVEACRKCQAVLLCDGTCEGARELYDALDLPLRVRSFCVPDALRSRHEAAVSLWVGTALSLDQETLRRAMRAAFAFAQEEDARLSHVSPAGASKPEWEAAVRVQEVAFPQVSASAFTAPDAVTGLIAAPGRMGLLLCPPYAGGILSAAATALCSQPALIHDMAWDETIGVFAPYLPPAQEMDEEINPFGLVYAVIHMLKHSLRLGREAACVEAAVNNVLSSGWRTPDQASSGASAVGGEAIINLICEQISVAGELMEKGGIR